MVLNDDLIKKPQSISEAPLFVTASASSSAVQMTTMDIRTNELTVLGKKRRLSSEAPASSAAATVQTTTMDVRTNESLDWIKRNTERRLAEIDQILKSDIPNPMLEILNPGKSRLLLKEAMIKEKIHCEYEKQMMAIHLQIVHIQQSFVEEKSKLMLENDDGSFYKRLRQWEIQFTELHLKPLYKERCTLTSELHYFWEGAMTLQKLVNDLITDKDCDILKFLIDIESSWLPDMRGFKLIFTFKQNSYFKNDHLTKTYQVIGDNESVTLKASGTEIDWISSCPFTPRQQKKSFFCTFFDPYDTTEPISFDTKDGELKGNIPTDYRIGKKFRDKIIPFATFSFVHLEIDDSDRETDRDRNCDCGGYVCVCDDSDSD